MKMMVVWAALLGMSGVILGAFGAHALKEKLPAERLQSYETGVRYQLIHAVALLAVAILAGTGTAPALLKGSAGLFAAGTVLFSFSIYLLTMRDVLGIGGWKWLGPVTPIGGLCLIAGWVLLLAWAIRLKV